MDNQPNQKENKNQVEKEEHSIGKENSTGGEEETQKAEVEPSQLIEAIIKSDQLDPLQKKSSVELIQEWYLEDQANGILIEELLEKFPFLESLFIELGLI